MLISMGASLSERAFHEYRQRVRFVWRERRNLLEPRTPVELERADTHVAGLEPRQWQFLGARPLEQPDEHGKRNAAAACLRLEIHALELGPAVAVLRRAASH